MKFFHELGRTVLERWQRADFDASAFPDLAGAVLSERPPSAHVEPMEVARWVLEEATLPQQVDLPATFGQPPITVFRCERFYIDVLFWVDGTTAIHQHRFSGAFHVLHGASLESTYRFRTKRRYSEALMSGDLELASVELLVKGDVRPILAGTGFVHALFHLDRPSVSVVVRTPGDVLAGPQYSYLRAGLAYDVFARPEATTRKLQTLELLHKIGRPDFESLAREAIQRADALLAFQLAQKLQTRLEPHEKYLAFLGSVAPAHPELFAALAVAAEDERRLAHIVSRRQLVKEADHRFFLALLLNLNGRRNILALVRQAFPDRHPTETVLGWLAALEKLDAINTWVSGVSKSASSDILDVRMDELSLRIVRDHLDEKPDDPSEPAEARARREALRNSMLLRPLFTDR